MGKISPELLNPAVAALALKQEDERLKTLDPVVITSLSFIPGKPKYLLMRGADSCALAHNIILSKEQALKLIRSLAEALSDWDKEQCQLTNNQEPRESGASLFGKTMKYTYRFKNPDIETALNVLCGKDYVQKAIREQYDNNNETIDFEFQSAPGESGASGCIWVSKSEIERVRAYNPDDWNPYPTVTPPVDGKKWLTQDEDGNLAIRSFARSFEEGIDYSWEDHDDRLIVAFRSLPGPYQPEETK